MFFLVFVLFLDCFFNMHLCAKLQPYSSNNFAHILGKKSTYINNLAHILREEGLKAWK